MKVIFNKFLMVLYFIVGALILEVVSFSVLGFGFLPEYLLYDLSLILIIAFVVFAIPNYVAQYVIFTIILLVQTILIYVNYSLYTIYGDLFSIEMITLIDEAAAAMTSSFVYIGVILQLIAVFLAIAIIGAIILKYCRKDKIKVWQHYSVFCVIALVVIQCFSISYYVERRNEINLLEIDISEILFDYSAQYTLYLKLQSYKKFGTYGYISNMLFANSQSVVKKLTDKTIEYMNSGNRYSSNSSEVFGVDEGNNVIVVMMESLEWFGFGDGTYDPNVENLSYELTPNIYSLIYGEDYLTDTDNVNKANDSVIATNYYSKSKTNFSEAQAILGFYPTGQNLTDIAGSDYDKSTNALGYSLPNMLKKLGYTTNYVHSNVIDFYDRDKTHGNLGFDNVIGKDNLVDENGDKIYTGSDLSWDHWASEADFVRNAMDYIVPETDNPFYTFYLNVSSHGSYEYNKNEDDCVRYRDYVMYGADDCILVDAETDEPFLDLEENVITDVETLQSVYPNANYKWLLNESVLEEDQPLDSQSEEVQADDNPTENKYTYTTWYQNVLDNYYDEDPSLCEELLYYQCGIMGLDEAIGAIVDRLKEIGEYDNTTILLFSDHYSYYANLSNRFKGLELLDYSSMEVNRIPMILSSPGLKSEHSGEYTVTTRFTTTYDIIPTIFDLLGIEFNENLYLGSSVFAYAIQDYVYTLDGETKEMLVYYSNTGGYFNIDVYSFDLTNFVKQNPNVDDEIVELFSKKTSELLLKLNYLKILNDAKLYNQLTNV